MSQYVDRVPDADIRDFFDAVDPSALDEKIIGAQSTLVPVVSLEEGYIAAKSVARVKRSDGSSGTGFLIEGDILITNNHVLPNDAVALSSVVQFNYQMTKEGLNAPIDEFRLSPEKFFKTSVKDDWTAVHVEGRPGGKWGILSLAPAQLKIGDYVNIIQHPGGGQKHTARCDKVMFVGTDRIQYLTDTLPGSSGSPVFNSRWKVVALHHSGGWLPQPNAQTKTTYYRNEGILIDRSHSRIIEVMHSWMCLGSRPQYHRGGWGRARNFRNIRKVNWSALTGLELRQLIAVKTKLAEVNLDSAYASREVAPITADNCQAGSVGMPNSGGHRGRCRLATRARADCSRAARRVS